MAKAGCDSCLAANVEVRSRIDPWLEATGLPVEVIKALNEGKDPSQLPQAGHSERSLVPEIQ